MNENIVIGTLGKKKNELKKFLEFKYNNADIISLDKISDIGKLNLIQTPDILFLCDVEFSEKLLNEIKMINGVIGTAIFCLNQKTGKNYAYFDSNMLYTSKDKNNFVPPSEIVETVGKMIRKNKIQLSLADEQIAVEDLEFYLDMINLWDSYTKGHCVRTQKYVDFFMEYINNVTLKQNSISTAALLHDIGKIAISRKILVKTDKLSNKDFDIIKSHALSANRYLPGEKFSDIRSLIVAHHENYNGSGYPYGLSKDEVPTGSYIIGLADSLDAMTTQRGYNKVKTLEQAREEILNWSGKQFEPKLANAFVEMTTEPKFINFYNEALEDSQKEKVLIYIQKNS